MRLVLIQVKYISFKNIEEMFEERNAEDKGRYFLCDCPECDKHEAFIYKNNPKMIICNRENECGERVFIRFERKKGFENERLIKAKNVYKNLNNEQVKSLDWAERAFKHFQLNIESETLKSGYRGISEDVTKQYIVDLQNKGMVKLMFKQMRPLFEKDYSSSDFMFERNLILPIYDDEGHVERILLRSTINKKLDPKEIQLVANPSKETRDFFVDLNGDSDVVVITEALFDSLSFKEIDRDVNFLSLTGASKTRQLSDYLIENKRLFKNKKFLFSLDNDIAGNEALQDLLDVIEEHNIGEDWNVFNYPDHIKAKDPNDLLQYDRNLFKKQYKQSVKDFVKTSAVMKEWEFTY